MLRKRRGEMNKKDVLFVCIKNPAVNKQVNQQILDITLTYITKINTIQRGECDMNVVAQSENFTTYIKKLRIDNRKCCHDAGFFYKPTLVSPC